MSSATPSVTAALRLHLNERTTGCSPAALAAIRALSAQDIGRYPEEDEAVRAVERWFGVPRGWVRLVNGLDEAIAVVTQQVAVGARLNFDVAVIEPTFEMYRACTEAMGGRVVAEPTPWTRLIFLCNPNNPTGMLLPDGTIPRIATAVPQATVFVDEAYAEFAGTTFIGAGLDRYRNVIVGRTFSKAYGLAGLRIGAIAGHPDTLAPLQPHLLPYRVNAPALAALTAALDDRDFVDRYVAECAASRRRLESFCATHGLGYVPSAANFMLIRIGPGATALAEWLLARGVVIRDRSRVPGCAGCVRITTGWIADTDRCLDLLEEYLATTRAR
ncbi:MAG TPA: histidinol-phosphate transaminase [Vicinamibacterales bacterium]|nr:histidinol-phosphate transaminase [Vicinamibacterales bacterium]